MRSRFTTKGNMLHVLAALMPANALAIEISMRYGLRISDVLSLQPAQVRQGRFTIHEQKTGKSRRIQLTEYLQLELLSQANQEWCFPGRCNPHKHRTRQAVYKDVVRAAKAFRLSHITPHSARKIYAVSLRERGKTLAEIQHILNHSDISTTMVYALADTLDKSNVPRKGH